MAKARILIVEDEFLVAHDISNMLIELGYEVAAIVSTAEDALAVIRNRAPDLILLDIRLKGPIDGIQAANIIKEEWSIPFIYLTAHADDLTLARAKSSDPLGYLLKPFRKRATLIGWSLGGLYAREVAKLLTPRVRQVITIGTPFNSTAIDVAPLTPATSHSTSTCVSNTSSAGFVVDVLLELCSGLHAATQVFNNLDAPTAIGVVLAPSVICFHVPVALDARNVIDCADSNVSNTVQGNLRHRGGRGCQNSQSDEGFFHFGFLKKVKQRAQVLRDQNPGPTS